MQLIIERRRQSLRLTGGKFEAHELDHAADIMNNKGYITAFFEMDCPGIEGFLFKSGSSPLPLSLKNLSTDNYSTIITEIDDVVTKINNNLNKFKGALKTGSNSNTIFELKIGKYNKLEFKNYLDSNPSKFLSNPKTKNMFKEIKFIFEDGTLRYDTNLNFI